MASAISFGGGVNSTALVILLATEGWRGDILFADTEAEYPDTYDYLEYFSAWLNRYGLGITKVGREFRVDKRTCLHGLVEFCEQYRMIPLAGIRWCTRIYKIDPLQNWCTQHSLDFDDLLVGISAEEAHRQPLKVRPLVERGIDRNACARIIQAEGLKVPRKSGCYICPFQKPIQWHVLREQYPQLFAKAVNLEDVATARCREQGKDKMVTFDPDGKYSLRDLADRADAQGSMFDYSLYYQPCMCRL